MKGFILMNKQEYREFREVMSRVIPKLHDTGTSIITGKNKLSVINGVTVFTDMLGMEKKFFPHYYSQIGEGNKMSLEDLKDLQHALNQTKNYI